MTWTSDFVTWLAKFAIAIFYKDVVVVGEDHVPRSRPLLLPITGVIAREIGLLPVNRGVKDYSKLYAATFECLNDNGMVAIFPEGTSYTQPHIYYLKDGAAWAAMEHAASVLRSWQSAAQSTNTAPPLPSHPPLPTAPSSETGANRNGIVTEEDTKLMDEIGFKEKTGALVVVGLTYVQKYLKDPKAAVKRLTADLTKSILNVTVNAPTWDDLDAANAARRILFPYPHLPLSLYPRATQALVDLLRLHEPVLEVDTWDYVNGKASTDPSKTPKTLPRTSLPLDLADIRDRLEDYTEQLRSLSLVDLDIQDFSPDESVWGAALRLLRATLGWLLGLPVFVPMQILAAPVQVPAYLVGRNEKFTESKAMKKIVVGVILIPIMYAISAYWIWRRLQDTRSLVSFIVSFPVVVATYVALYDQRADSLRALVGRFHLLLALTGTRTSRTALDNLVSSREKLRLDLQIAINLYGSMPREAISTVAVDFQARFADSAHTLRDIARVVERAGQGKVTREV
ncbi:hypothetical protein HDU93_001837 [Gonapodya sp. JEL0774]|nr:hypothetical protein HDU93_001837 [Gonapodya sp. JEL0774]